MRKHISALLLVFVLLFSLVVPVSAAAGPTESVSGSWFFKPSVSITTSVTYLVNFTCDSIHYSSITIFLQNGKSNIRYQDPGAHRDLLAYSDGWKNDAYRTITLDGTQTVDPQFYSFLISNASRVGDASFSSSHTFYIDNTLIGTLDFNAESNYTLTVSSSEVVFSSSSKTVRFAVNAGFLGLSTTDGGAVDYPVGASSTFPVTVAGSFDHNFYTVYEADAPHPVLSTTINIDGVPYVFSNNGETTSSPVVTISVAANGVTLGSSGRIVTIDVNPGFLGLTAVADVPPDFYAVGKNTTAGGREGDNTIVTLYTYYSSDPEAPPPSSSVIFRIYDVSGSKLLHSISFSDVGATTVSFLVTPTGCEFLHDGVTYPWSTPYTGFSGFTQSANSTDATLPVGSSHVFTADAGEDLIIVFYSVDSGLLPGQSNPDDDVSFLDFTAWLVRAVASFLSFEFVPGFSFDRLIRLCILFGLVFWFLKVVK